MSLDITHKTKAPDERELSQGAKVNRQLQDIGNGRSCQDGR